MVICHKLKCLTSSLLPFANAPNRTREELNTLKSMDETLVLRPEWAPQSGVMLTWPHRGSDWQPLLADAESNFTAIARAISQREKVLIVCSDQAHREHVQKLLADAGARMEFVGCFEAPSNDTWARDHGPITVHRAGRPTLIDFRFNGWGEKFDHDLDDRIVQELHAAGAFGDTPLERTNLVLEGGSIETDGYGTLLTTTSCLLSPRRNRLDRTTLEQKLRAVLGVRRFLWLNQGYLEGDDTDGHIDTLARFCDARTIAYQTCDDADYVHFASLTAMKDKLAQFGTANGDRYRLVPLPWPGPKLDDDGKRRPASYANFLIINGAVLVPTYDDPADSLALERLQECFPERETVGIPCLTLIRQGGSLHCITMQLPEGVLPD